MMKTNTMFWLKGSAVLIATLALVVGCGGGDDDSGSAAAGPAAAPDSAAASGSSFASFIQSLARGDETSEPLTFSASFANPPEDNTGDFVPLV